MSRRCRAHEVAVEAEVILLIAVDALDPNLTRQVARARTTREPTSRRATGAPGTALGWVNCMKLMPLLVRLSDSALMVAARAEVIVGACETVDAGAAGKG